MAGHSRSKNGVASLAYARPSTSSVFRQKDVDARHEAGHDACVCCSAHQIALALRKAAICLAP
jgi:hypothetical protein